MKNNDATKVEKYETFLEICSLLYSVDAQIRIVKAPGDSTAYQIKINDRITSQESVPLMRDEVIISSDDSLVSLKETLQTLTDRLNKIKTNRLNLAAYSQEILDALGV